MKGNVFYYSWEPDLISFLQSSADRLFIMLVSFFSLFGEEPVLVGVIGLFYWAIDKEKGKHLGTNIMITLLSGTALKNILVRIRPYFVHDSVFCLRPVDRKEDIFDIAAQGYSMPSLHSANAFALYGSLAQIFRKKWLIIAGAAVTLLVGVSRVILGVHYPTDVLAGWGVAIFAILAGAFLEKKCTRLTAAIAVPLIFLPGWFFCKSSDFYSSYGLSLGLLTAFFFEEKKVCFRNTKKVLFCILRFTGGLLVFLSVSGLVKLITPGRFEEGIHFAAHFARSLRYALSGFAAIGLYPMLFKILGI